MTFAKQGAEADRQVTNEEGKQTEKSADQVFLEIGDRKFSSKDDVITKISKQDSHISEIEAENAALRDKLNELSEKEKSDTIVLDELERMKQELSDKGLTPEQVQTLVSETIQTSKQEESRKANHSLCETELQKAYGDEYLTILNKKAAELGMSLEEADEIAYKNPKLFTKTFVESGSSFSTTNTNRGNSDTTASFREAPNTGYEVKTPLSLRTTKERTENFLALLQEKVA